MQAALKTIVFTALVPGTVTGWLPWLLLPHGSRPLPFDVLGLRCLGLLDPACRRRHLLMVRLGFHFHRPRARPLCGDPPKLVVTRGLYRPDAQSDVCGHRTGVGRRVPTVSLADAAALRHCCPDRIPFARHLLRRAGIEETIWRVLHELLPDHAQMASQMAPMTGSACAPGIFPRFSP